MATAAVFAPLLAPDNPAQQDLLNRLSPPSWLHHSASGGWHLMGTDELGRDVLSRVLYGARVSLGLGVVCTAVSATLGLTAGLLAGLKGGRVDAFLMRLVDSQLAFPFVVLALAVIAVSGPSIWVLAALLSWLGWAQFARLVRGQTQSVAQQEYIKAAWVLGAGTARVALQEVLPNLLGPFMVMASFNVAQVIIVESSLDFLGVGIQAPTPSWGNMLSESQQYLTNGWWIALFPGIALMITIMTVYLLGAYVRRSMEHHR